LNHTVGSLLQRVRLSNHCLFGCIFLGFGVR
jgi:hypothetical protein